MAELKHNSRKRPLWFVFPGSGTYCEGAGRDLMKIPVFAATIERAAAVLRPFDFDLIWILTEAPKAVVDDVTNAMVSIMATQLALFEVLRASGLDPDGMFGPSLGELGSAYADKTLTLEQTMLVAYWQGRCLVEAKVPVGPKAILFLTMDQFAKRRCPPAIEVIGINTHRVTVLGPDSSVRNLVDTLASEGIHGKIFGTNFLQFHSSYVDDALSPFRKHLERIICDPKPHSSKWISTIVPPDKWDSKPGKSISAEYFVNNLRSCVNMITPMHALPQNAVLVEISVNAKLLAYMTNLPATAVPIELIPQGGSVSAVQLFQAIGKIFEAMGQQPPVEQLTAVFGDLSAEAKGHHSDNDTK